MVNTRSGGPAVAIATVSKQFGGRKALDGATLLLQEGEILGLLGPNGAGKTTMVRCVMGRTRPDAGSVSVLGVPSGTSEARAALGWVPQDLALYPHLTVEENLLVFGRYQGLHGDDLGEAVLEALRWSALADRGADRVVTLSGGMKRRLNMAAGLVHRPRVALLDEPTVGVDPQSRERIYAMIEELRKKGTSILYTTHYMEEAERLCDRVAIVDRGRVIALGTRDELVNGAFGSACELSVVLGSPPSAAAASWVSSLGGQRDGARLQFTLVDPVREVADLLLGAREQAMDVQDLQLRRPNLESVFLHLTGRELRE